MTRHNSSNGERIGGKINRRGVLQALGAAGAGITLSSGLIGTATAAPGDKIAEVELPGHSQGVGLTFDGTYVYTIGGGSLAADVLQTFSPPADGNGTATLEAEKDIVDGSGNPVTISGIEWDPTRGKLWGAHNSDNAVYLLDIGDPTDASQDVIATFQFAPDTGGYSLTDGLAYDARDDTLWYTPDVSVDVWHFKPDGTLIKTITPKNSDGNPADLISGVALGADDSGRPTLFCGRNGESEIIRVYADDGEFLESFANLPFRVEDLACDPVTYDSEAILTKDAYDQEYFALEVQSDTCPIAGREPADNKAPSAACDFSYSGDVPDTGDSITFDGSGSSDPDGDSLTYEWDFDGDGSTDATGETVTHTFTSGGEKTVTLTVSDPDGASDTCELTFTVWIAADIDIKPCSDPNAINPDDGGVIPVGMKQTGTFDPTTRVAVDTLRFGAPDVVKAGGGATAAHEGHVEDVVPCEGDGKDDLVVHFPTEDTGFDGDEEYGRLEGETDDGVPVFGKDTVKLVGGGGGLIPNRP